MKAALISYDDVREVDLKTNSAGSAYAAIRSAVEGGFVEPFNALYGASITLYVNDNGIAEGQQPNRAVYANERMQEMRYLSMMAPASFKAVRKATCTRCCSGRSWPSVTIRTPEQTGISSPKSSRPSCATSGTAPRWARDRAWRRSS